MWIQDMMPTGRGLFLLAIGALMIFGGYLKTKPKATDDMVTKWKETIDKWENLNHALKIDVAKDVEDSDPGTLARMITQLNTLSRNLDELRTAASNEVFCQAIEIELPSYNCRRVNDLINRTEEKVSNAIKVVNETMDAALKENEKYETPKAA